MGKLLLPFTDNMVLQREAEVPVWGFDDAGATVTVSFAGQTHTVVADDKGEWMVELNPLAASRNERGFEVKNNQGESISLAGVLVGEVWFSSWPANSPL